MSGNIESFFSRDLDTETIEEVYKIEQDMWARENGLGEYIVCENCSTISSKESVYNSLESIIRKKTVADIENILGGDTIKCPNCASGNTRHMRGEECKNHIQNNLSLPKSFCTLMKNSREKVVGFMYGYVGNFDQIYKSEFKEHFSPQLEEVIITNGVIQVDENFLSLPSIGTNEEHMNMFSMIKMMKSFFSFMPNEYKDIVGITEVALEGTMTEFYKNMGAYGLNIPILFPHILKTKHDAIDILIQPNIVRTYQEKLGDMRSFLYTLKNNRKEAKAFV